MRHPAWWYLGVLALVGAAYLIVLVTNRPTRPADDRPPPPVQLDLPRQPELPPSPFTAREQVILQHLGRGPVIDYSPPTRADVERQARLDREFDSAGGNSPDAFPLYLRLLEWCPPIDPSVEASIFSEVARIPGDRAAFRPFAVARLNDPKTSVASAAVRLLGQIGTPTEAAAVTKLFDYYEYDFPGEKRDVYFFMQVLTTLAAIGTEAEIQAINEAKAKHLLWDRDDFWKKAEECKAAIRERLAKEKADKK